MMSNTFTKKHGNQKYPWPRWMDGKWHTVIRGKHFSCKPLNFRRRLDQQEKETGIQVEIQPMAATDQIIKFRFKVETAN
jgi:hypothetical protein